MGQGTATVNFDGGRLVATGDEADFVTSSADAQFSVLAGGGTIDNNGHAIGIQSPIGGIGALTFTGSGVTTLTGANTYSGGTTVSGGTLKGDTTSLQGNIVNNAAVVFDQSDPDALDWHLRGCHFRHGLLDQGRLRNPLPFRGKHICRRNHDQRRHRARDGPRRGQLVAGKWGRQCRHQWAPSAWRRLRPRQYDGERHARPRGPTRLAGFQTRFAPDRHLHRANRSFRDPASSDLIGVSGQLTYDGTLSIAFLGDYLPGIGDSFHVFGTVVTPLSNFDAISFGRVGYAGTFDPITGNLFHHRHPRSPVPGQ